MRPPREIHMRDVDLTPLNLSGGSLFLSCWCYFAEPSSTFPCRRELYIDRLVSRVARRCPHFRRQEISIGKRAFDGQCLSVCLSVCLWPVDALTSVAKRFLSENKLLTVSVFLSVCLSVSGASMPSLPLPSNFYQKTSFLRSVSFCMSVSGASMPKLLLPSNFYWKTSF